jgi:hypothetical protein
MSKKITVSGRKLKNLSDPTLAHSHPQGATVNYALTSVDPKWGRYLYLQYRRNGFILRAGARYYKLALKSLEKCRKLPVEDKSGFRKVPDKLKIQFEIQVIQFLTLTKLGLEYLITEYELGVKQIKTKRNEPFSMPSNEEDLVKRLETLAKAVGVVGKFPTEIHTIIDRRHIVEHPTTDRLWNGTDTGWKTVNLSWALSGELEGILDPLIVYVNEFVEEVEKYIADNPIPGELNISHRGLKAGEQYKKPR